MAANAAVGGGAIAPGIPLMALGLISVLMAAFSLWQRRDVKRFFAFSTIEQSGLAAFAFGLGGPVATFAGLLHITLHTLSKASVFQCVGRAAQLKGGQHFSDIGGLLGTHRMLAVTLAVGVVAVAALPPLGVFASEFMIATETILRAPWLALPLGIGLLVGAWALLARLQMLCLGAPTPDRGPAPDALALLPVWLMLAVVLVLGLAMPAPVADWLRAESG
jgi:hydrogenase-4 component F